MAGNYTPPVQALIDEFGRLQVATSTGLETFAVGDVVHARMHR